MPCFRACTTIFVAISASVRLFGKRLFAGKPIEDRYIIGTVRRDILTAVRHYGWTSAYRIRLYYTSRLMLSFAILLSIAGLSFALFRHFRYIYGRQATANSILKRMLCRMTMTIEDK